MIGAETPTSSKLLCVDLDGSLIKSDVLFETTVLLLRKNPLYVFSLPVWLSKGKANLKRQIALRVNLDVANLPYNESLLAYLRKESEAGRQLLLATASDSTYAEKIAAHLGLFSTVLASDGVTNMDGFQKAQHLNSRYGQRGYEYVGNSNEDLKVWKHAHQAHIVGSSSSLVGKVKQVTGVGEVFSEKKSYLKVVLKSIRIHQVLKNILIFVPIVTSHNLTDPYFLSRGIFAFISFSFCCAAVYLLNDLLDIEADRRHAYKKFRPLPAGHLSIPHAVVMIGLSGLGCLLAALPLPVEFTLVLSVYFSLTIAYSLFLKRTMFLDVLLLAFLYVIRIVAGHAATEIPYSTWLLGFSLFFFLSLALLKRFSELKNNESSDDEIAAGRSYTRADMQPVGIMGISAGYLAVVIFTLYIDSQKATVQYGNPLLLWFMCPLFLYWLSRLWLLAYRGQMHEDAIRFAIKDKASWCVGILSALLIFAAR